MLRGRLVRVRCWQRLRMPRRPLCEVIPACSDSVAYFQMRRPLTPHSDGPATVTEHSTRKTRPNLRARIRVTAVDLLHRNPGGLTYTELIQATRQLHPDRNVKTLSNDIVNLDRHVPDKVYKPVKGVYMHTRFRDAEDSPPGEQKALSAARSARVPEEKFYPLFAAWLKNDLEEVTVAIPLGGNAFRDRWGTPDVLGKNESRRSDVIKGPTSIVSAEIKIDTASLVTGFGQACAYRLFSHKSYLVIPDQTPAEELGRLEALCQMFGIGLVVFDAASLTKPSFRLLARPVKHDPDLYYTNRYIKHVERKLFS